MIEIQGDFWHVHINDYDAICCTTNNVVKENGELVMGAGIAKEFARLFPFLPLEWGGRVKEYLTRRGFATGFYNPPVLVSSNRGVYTNPEIALVSFPTKVDWRSKSDISLIIGSAEKLITIADAHGWKKILLTRPGCGMGGLDWNDVRDNLSPIFDERFVIINKD